MSLWLLVVSLGLAADPPSELREPDLPRAGEPSPLVPPSTPRPLGPPATRADGLPLPLPPSGALPAPVERAADGLPLPVWRPRPAPRPLLWTGLGSAVVGAAAVGLVVGLGPATRP